MKMFFWVPSVSVCFLSLSLSACDIDEKYVPFPLSEQKEHMVSVPFDGAKGFLSSGLLSNEPEMSFAKFLENPLGKKWVSDLKIQFMPELKTTTVDNKNSNKKFVLSMNQNIVMSFHTFSEDTPIHIYTNGYDLTLIGNDMRNLKITGTASNRPTGKLNIFITGSHLPDVDMSGAAGRSGVDGLCPTSATASCLSDTPPRSPSGVQRYKIVQKTLSEKVFSAVDAARQDHEAHEYWNRLGAPTPDGQLIKSIVYSAPVPLTMRHLFCPAGILNLVSVVTNYSGSFRVVVQEDQVQDTDPLAVQGSPGLVFPGQKGGDGYDGGDVSIVSLNRLPQSDFKFSNILINGGQGGKAGRSGMILPGFGAPAHELKLIKVTSLSMEKPLFAEFKAVKKGDISTPTQNLNARMKDTSIEYCWDCKMKETTQDFYETRAFHFVPLQWQSLRSVVLSSGKSGEMPNVPQIEPGNAGKTGKISYFWISNKNEFIKSLPEFKMLPASLKEILSTN